MDLHEIKDLITTAKIHVRDGRSNFLLVGFTSSDDGSSSNHFILGRFGSRDEALERACSPFDSAYILEEEELANGLISRLVSEIEILHAASKDWLVPKTRYKIITISEIDNDSSSVKNALLPKQSRRADNG